VKTELTQEMQREFQMRAPVVSRVVDIFDVIKENSALVSSTHHPWLKTVGADLGYVPSAEIAEQAEVSRKPASPAI
jgi:hypothetical protein